ncbi:MAG: Acetate kinase [Bryobacterales bacterium]|nr:Acetate kinase [Bryobacterales bacterium]
MASDGPILAINGGSSTIRFAVYSAGRNPERLVSGKLERVGEDSVAKLVTDLAGQVDFASLRAVGHRVVHGMRRSAPAIVTPELLDELRGNIPFDPEHLPREIELMEAVGSRYPKLQQVACFDTAFHSTMPGVARLLPIPRRYAEQGIVRYGFHGLSYAYLMEELGRVAGAETARGKVVIAHLGNGASLCAVRGGESIDTTMGLTPAGGVPMGTRSGDLDPGVALFLLSSAGITAEQFSRLVNHESGLLGLSETSSDMRDLLSSAGGDKRAAEAVDIFCYQVRKSVGALAAALEGLDALVFSGGIGENSPAVRARVCNGLRFLGIELDSGANSVNALSISVTGGSVAVYCIPTNEELMISKLVLRLLEAKTEE